MSPTRRVSPATRTLVAGAALIAAAWLLAPAPAPPLYDGLSGPAQAYVYVSPPPGYHQTQQASPATKSLPVSSGATQAAFVTTDELPPQAQVLAGEGAFTVPAGTTSVALTVTPVTPPQPLPAALGAFDGNVYRIEATAGSAPVPVATGHPITVVLRGPATGKTAAMVRLPDTGTSTPGAWESIKSVPLGSAPDMISANTDRLGWFAMVLTGTSSTSGGSPGGSSGPNLVAIVVPVAAVVLAAIAATLLLLRRRGSW
ncbi:MAG TPA: hypothetical protein VGQ42_11875 [Candidatus Dormibacteraeota bacterium]|jgi:hypothetical protein|nr:hypothetical protein [Candidatus Dormibacteraeota bacterium]